MYIIRSSKIDKYIHDVLKDKMRKAVNDHIRKKLAAKEYNWSWLMLSFNPLITWDIVMENLDKPWNWNALSMSKNITFDIIKGTLGSGVRDSRIMWSWEYVCRNPNIVWENILELIEVLGIHDDSVGVGDGGGRSGCLLWSHISWYKGIPIEYIFENAERKWNWYALSGNENITIEYARFYRDKTNGMLDINLVYDTWVRLSKNKVFTWQDVIDNPDIPWDYRGLSYNPNITWDIILENIDKPWSWFMLSYKKGLTADIVKKCIDKEWHIYGIYRQDNMDWDTLQRLFSGGSERWHWSWHAASASPSVTCDIVRDNIDKLWDWSSLSVNPNIDWGFICEHVENEWDWQMLSNNVNITWEIVRDNLDKEWGWYAISCRGDMLLSDAERVKIAREYMACRVIQRAWRECVANPWYMVCGRRLMREIGDWRVVE